MLRYLILHVRYFIILVWHYVMLHYFDFKLFDVTMFNDTRFDFALY